MKNKRNNQGQTAVEYILLLAVVVAMLVPLLQKLKAFALADAGNCTPASKSLVCNFDKMFTRDQYVYFYLMR